MVVAYATKDIYYNFNFKQDELGMRNFVYEYSTC